MWVQLCSELNYTEAFNKYSLMHNFVEAMFCETNPVPIKYALFLQDMYKSDECRLPLAQLSKENKNKVVVSMNQMKSNFFTVNLSF